MITTTENNLPAIQIYTALLTQLSTDPPTAKILSNTLATIVWTRTGVGTYTGTATKAFTTDKTYIVLYDNSTDPTISIAGLIWSEDEVRLYVNGAGGPEDAWLADTPIEIRVYNV